MHCLKHRSQAKKEVREKRAKQIQEADLKESKRMGSGGGGGRNGPGVGGGERRGLLKTTAGKGGCFTVPTIAVKDPPPEL